MGNTVEATGGARGRVSVKKQNLAKVFEAKLDLETGDVTDPGKLVAAIDEMMHNLDPLTIGEAIDWGHNVLADVRDAFEEVVQGDGHELVLKADVLAALRQAFNAVTEKEGDADGKSAAND